MAETMDKTEMLILEVSKNPVLFDKTEEAYKDATKKKNIWKGIGEKIGQILTLRNMRSALKAATVSAFAFAFYLNG